MTKSRSENNTRTILLGASRDAFIFSVIGLVILMVFLVVAEDGANGTAAIAGLPLGPVSPDSLNILIGIDMIIPLGYGVGFILLLAGLSGDTQKNMIAFAGIVLAIVGITLDFTENGMVLTMMGEQGERVFWTAAKYGTMASCGFLVTTLSTPGLISTSIFNIAFRYIVPLVLAVTLMDFNRELEPWLLVPGLIITFLFLAWVANEESRAVSE